MGPRNDRPWIALFSQSGSEIVAIAEAIGIWPDFIYTCLLYTSDAADE